MSNILSLKFKNNFYKRNQCQRDFFLLHKEAKKTTESLPDKLLGIFQASILEWVSISYSRGSSQPRDQTHVSCKGKQIFYHCTTWENLEGQWRPMTQLKNPQAKRTLSYSAFYSIQCSFGWLDEVHPHWKWKWSCSVISDSLRPHGL